MKYATLVYMNPAGPPQLDEAAAKALTAEYWGLREDPICIDGAHLQPPEMTTTVQDAAGRPVITDGPFADAKEGFGGYYVVDAPDLDAALDFARRIPAVRMGGAVEVRPLVQGPTEMSS